MHDYIFTESKIFTRAFTLLGAGLFIWGLLTARKTYRGCDERCRLVYNIFLWVCIINVIIGIPALIMEGRAIEILANPHVWMFVMGISVLFPIEEEDICQIMRWSLLYAITSVLFALLFFRDIFLNPAELFATMTGWQTEIVNKPQEPANLLFPISGFLVLISCFPLKWRWFLPIAFAIAILSGLLGGRRSTTVILLSFVLIPILLYTYGHVKRMLGYVFIVFFLGITTLLFVPTKTINNYFDTYFSVLSSRITSDTRSEAENDFYEDFKDPVDWVLGRSAAGTYYSPALSSIDKLNRDIMETGYLNIILHAGLLMLIPYVILLLYAFIGGFFFSNSIFIKSCSLFVILHLVFLYPGGSIKQTLEFYILFIFIRMCISSKWRLLTDDDFYRMVSCAFKKDDNIKTFFRK